MKWKNLLWCFSVLCISSRVSTIPTLHKIEDLKSTEFGREYPRHGLLVLHWLASQISIDETEDILLHFKPSRQDYGFQRDTNPQIVEKVTLSHDSLGREFYSIGSLSLEEVRTKLPSYVTQDYYNSLENPNRDIDRIVVRMQRSSPMRVDKVYITQREGKDYDLNKTYEISPKLLREIQVLQKPLNMFLVLLSGMYDNLNSTSTELDDPRLRLNKDLLTHRKIVEKHLKTIFEQPDLRWLLSLAGYNTDARYKVHKETWHCSTDEKVQHVNLNPETACEGTKPVKIEVRSTSNGYARLTWNNIPENILKQSPTIVLFGSDTSGVLDTFVSLEDQSSGSADTFVALNHGLQPRLVTFDFKTDHGFIGLSYSVFLRGPQFDAANRVLPTEISGYNASLQLYTTDGYACVRLYIKKSFNNWKDEFQASWVGFYAKEQDDDRDYQHYQWVSMFEKVGDKDDTKEYLIYQYVSSISIGPGVQARFLFSQQTVRYRFLLRWYSPTVKARTVPWESQITQ
ncbi:uncharacterized protein [Hoplias malabaricus]|uniref:uncharacterized protein n=1 Tax=Hoplias malabaricus TaxID=27720 RepID=UPI0034633AA1